MKNLRRRKGIVIISLFFFILLISIAIFFFKDSISNGIKYGRWFTLDTYEDLLGDCDWERHGKELKVKCNALIYPASEIDKIVEDRCYNFLIVSKNDNNKKPEIFNICEKWNRIDWDTVGDWLAEKEKMTPVKLNLLYSTKNFGSYTYNGFEILKVSPNELFDEFYMNRALKEILFPIVADYDNKEDFNNYVHIDKGTFGIDEIAHLYFVEAKLLEKIVEDETMYFTFETRIKEKAIKLKIHTKGFLLIKDIEQGNFQEYITLENIDKIEINTNYEFRFFYLTSKTEDLQQKIEERCNNQEIHIANKSLCDNKEEILSNEFSPTSQDGILDYLTSNKEDSILDLDDVILFIVI